MQKITTFLTYKDQAEEAVNFYISLFKNSNIVSVMRSGEAGPGPKGSLLSATFQLEGQDFIALNGGPHFTFAQGISLFVSCETQEEIDRLYEKALRRRRKTAMRLGERQIWCVLADSSTCFGRDAARQGS